MQAPRARLLRKIQEYEFVCVELNEYLDTHPDDLYARGDYNGYCRCLAELKYDYENAYGPLRSFGASPWENGSWVCSPWPWEGV